ncbi:phage tail tape measure protein [Maribacter sp. ACAM166]|uniref:phage tail tape measure protein n=1 Tax=Maribacter sp. ACAM166 TaxID=2508996 RepID=UPI0010FD4C61|nr:phage tail tape measure protein [Maribacter sp. ACAM166]TLP81355.1 phage tail tape measure protein [Maribacter sp. ACAM166]
MSTTTTSWILKLVDQVSGPMNTIKQAGKSTKEVVGQVNENLKKVSAIDLYAIADSARQLNQHFQQAIRPGIAYEATLADVSAITGVMGENLEKLGENARKSAKIFGTSASQPLENYKTILSKLGPGIGQNEKALDSMNASALTLSKTMDNDVKGAVEALTTSMLQYRVDLTDPIKASKEMEMMMNVMAAGAKEGSAEIPQISQAIKVAGVAASQAKVSFVETNAAIQALAAGGKVGAEGGMALRNVLGKMAGADVIPKEALQKLQRYGVDMAIVSNTTLPFTTRLKELGKAQGDATAFAQVFGVENAAAANILVRSVTAQDDLAKKIAGTNVAYEQAKIKMDTYQEKQGRLTATMEDWGITLFNATKPFIPFIIAGLGAVEMLSHLGNAQKGVALIMDTKLGKGLKFIRTGLNKATLASGNFVKGLVASGANALKAGGRFIIAALTGLGSFIVGLVSATAAQWGFNVAMNANPIGLLVIGIAAAIGVIILMVKYWDEIKGALIKFGAWIAKNNPFEWMVTLIDKVFPGFRVKIEALKTWVKDLLMGVWESIKKVWNGIKEFFGFGDDNTVEVEVTKKPSTDPTKLDVPAGTIDTNNGVTPTNGNAPVISGNGSGGSAKILTMNLDITNNFSLQPGNWKNDIDNIADEIVGRINDRMRDGAISLG